jgi:hypothetical protein
MYFTVILFWSNARSLISATEITLKLAEIFPNWRNFAQIGAQKTNHGRNSANLDGIRQKSVAEIKLYLFI